MIRGVEEKREELGRSTRDVIEQQSSHKQDTSLWKIGDIRRDLLRRYWSIFLEELGRERDRDPSQEDDEGRQCLKPKML